MPEPDTGYYCTSNLDLAAYLVVRGHDLKRLFFSRGTMSFFFGADAEETVSEYVNGDEVAISIQNYTSVRKDLYHEISDRKRSNSYASR